MKPQMPKKIFIASILFGILLTILYSLLTSFTLAFNPPTGSGGSGSGAIGVDGANNLAIGTSTSGLDSKVLIYATPSNTFILKVVSPTSSPIFVVKNDGRVGIATSTPTSTLTVQGDLTVTGSIFGQAVTNLNAANVQSGVFGGCCGGGNYSFPSGGRVGIATTTNVSLPQQLSVYGGAYVSGNVGIGTTDPRSLLHVAQNDGAGDAVRAPIIMSRYWASDTNTRAAAIYNYYNSGTVNDQLVFGVTGGGGSITSPTLYSNAKMVIQGNGNVGIGTATPGAKLEVAGQIKITGGSPGLGKVLTSDTTGLASWEKPSASIRTTVSAGIVYRNVYNRILLVVAWANPVISFSSCSLDAYIGNINPPDSLIASESGTSRMSITFIVPAEWYYRVDLPCGVLDARAWEI